MKRLILSIIVALCSISAFSEFVNLPRIDIVNKDIKDVIRKEVIPYIDSIGGTPENTTIAVSFQKDIVYFSQRGKIYYSNVSIYLMDYPHSRISEDGKGYTEIDGYMVIVYGTNKLYWKNLPDNYRRFELRTGDDIYVDGLIIWYYLLEHEILYFTLFIGAW